MTDGAELFKPGTREPIRLPAMLVVEGRDMFGFFLAQLRELGLDKQIEVRNGGGVPDLYDYLGVLPNISGFDAVTSLGVACDSETNPNDSFQALCSALKRAGLPEPAAAFQATSALQSRRVTIALLPDAATPGMLESLLWRALSGDARVSCIDEFVQCVESATGQPLARIDKSRVHAYIAARDEPWFLVGQAARSGYFPWESPVFDEIKGFVRSLI